MRYILFYCLLAPYVVCENALENAKYTVARIKPKGFRISLSGIENIKQIIFHVNIGKPRANPDQSDFSAIITEPTNGQWAFDNINTFVEPNTSIYFWLEVSFTNTETKAHTLQDLKVPEDSIELPEFCPNPSSVSNTPKTSTTCEPSVTTVGHKPVCKGALIFHDEFKTLNLTTWSREVFMPFDKIDASFVSYQNLWENCYVTDGKLHISPTFQSDIPGYDELKIRKGSIELEGCTGAKDKPWECSRQAKFSQILPPIISAKIHTKDSFSFRYGRIQIGARLPKGDWLFPMILLEPRENYYGVEEYVSGQIRIAYNQGNRHHEIYGGVIISDNPALRIVTLKSSYADTDYHRYTLDWTEDHISLWRDDYEYGYIQGDFSKVFPNLKHSKEWAKGGLMAPFDREFYLSLAVSVGGHSEFSDGIKEKSWKNGDPKAMLDFWKDRRKWRKTWKDESRQLQIHYIKIFAL